MRVLPLMRKLRAAYAATTRWLPLQREIELPQRALHKLRLAHSSTEAGQDGELIQQLAGWLAHAPVGLMRHGYHPVDSSTCTVVLPTVVLPGLLHLLKCCHSQSPEQLEAKCVTVGDEVCTGLDEGRRKQRM